MTDPKDKPLIDEIEQALRKMLKEVMSGKGKGDDGLPYSLTDKMKVADRLLKLAAVKAKMEDDDWGKGFQDDKEA
jgi:hypothetical protein